MLNNLNCSPMLQVLTPVVSGNIRWSNEKMIKNLILTTFMTMLSLGIQAQTQMVRIADIEVYPQYLDEYIKAGKEIATISMREEAGVICLFPNQMKEDKIGRASCRERV